MTREEAINEVRSWSLSKKTREILEALIPELRESEDERIRKEIVDYFKKECECLLNDFRDKEDEKRLSFYNKALAYLEKQKEPVVDKEGMYYYLGGKFIYCGFPVTEENPYDFAMSQQEKEKTKRMLNTITYKMSQHQPDIFTEEENEWFNAYLERQKEPENVSATTMIPSCWAEEPSLQKEQPAEWSEEEYGRLFDIEHYLDGTLQLNPDRKIACIDFLKSLRPSWKPSKEDLMMLEHIIEQYEIGNKNSKVRGYLPKVEELNFLKKVFEIWKN